MATVAQAHCRHTRQKNEFRLANVRKILIKLNILVSLRNKNGPTTLIIDLKKKMKAYYVLYCMLYKPDFPYPIFAKSLEFSKSLQDQGDQCFLIIL